MCQSFFKIKKYPFDFDVKTKLEQDRRQKESRLRCPHWKRFEKLTSTLDSGSAGGQDVRVEALGVDLRVVASSLDFDMQCWLGLPACRDKSQGALNFAHPTIILS